MFSEVFQHTPKWVFAIFALLLWRGLSSMLRRSVSLQAATLFPVAMLGLALWGIASAFGHASTEADALLAWATGAALAGPWMYARSTMAGIRYDAQKRRFDVPGSAWPLLLSMGIFCLKFMVGVSLALQPQLADKVRFALAVGCSYGVFSGIFMARVARLWQLAWQQDKSPMDTRPT